MVEKRGSRNGSKKSEFGPYASSSSSSSQVHDSDQVYLLNDANHLENPFTISKGQINVPRGIFLLSTFLPILTLVIHC